MSTFRSFARQTWNHDRILTATGLAMLTLLPVTLAGVLVDARLLDGVPVWLKPAKFAASTAVYSLTLPWVLAALRDWPRLRHAASRVTVGVMVLEVAVITIQAWRGVASHFNVSTPLDAALFGVMGAAIAAQTVVAGLVAFALVRQRFDDEVMGTAMRAGMIIAVLGASTGGLMTSPSRIQIDEAVRTGHMTRAGGHTVGAPDGTPGLAGIGWSREHGDLRVPHFIGLHALQALPLVALAWRRRTLAEVRRMRIVAAGYAGFFALTLVQALLGEPLLSPGPLVIVPGVAIMLGGLAAWYATGARSGNDAVLTGSVGGVL